MCSFFLVWKRCQVSPTYTEELHNIEDVFVANGYPRETVRRFMEQRPQQIDKREQEEPESRGVVTIPYFKRVV